MIVPSPDEFLNRMRRLRYPVIDEPLNVNIVGYRKKVGYVNEFNDFIAVYVPRGSGTFEYDFWPATTVPGVPWLKNPMNKSGTAILVPGHYEDCYRIGEHHGYRALKQVAPVRVFRDNNRDSEADLENVKIESGLFGINIHRAGWASKIIGTSSAGCQVFKNRKDFGEFMSYCEEAANLYENNFSYTLLDEVNGN